MGGFLVIALGAGALLVVLYELYGTSLFTEASQRRLTASLERNWADSDDGSAGSTPVAEPVEEGAALLRLYIPAFGPGYAFTVLEGTGGEDLAAGPGHYSGTALPGQPGNFAMAGHRVTHSAPFQDLDTLRSCDAVVVETRAEWFVYRVLPMSAEVRNWAAGRGADEHCRGVAPLVGPYAQVFGREVVGADDLAVLAAVPGDPAATPGDAGAALLTMTTCEPKFSAARRLIVHGVLVGRSPRSGPRPAELAQG